jgi:hypothetical protein
MRFVKAVVSTITWVLLSACGGGGSSTASTESGSSNNATSNGGTGGGSTSNGGGSNGSNTATSSTNTQAVLSYVNTRHRTMQANFLNSESALSQSLSAQGKFRSGEHYIKSGDSYVSSLESYLADSVTQARSLNALLPVDSATISTLLNTYKAQDLEYVSSYYSSANWGLENSQSLMTVINDIRTRVSAKYDAAINSLP